MSVTVLFECFWNLPSIFLVIIYVGVNKIEMIFDLCGVHMRSVCYSYLIQKWEEV